MKGFGSLTFLNKFFKFFLKIFNCSYQHMGLYEIENLADVIEKARLLQLCLRRT